MNWLIFILFNLNLTLGFLIYLGLNRSKRHLIVNRIYLLLFPVLLISLSLISIYADSPILSSISMELPIIQFTPSEIVPDSTPSVNWIILIYLVGGGITCCIWIIEILKIKRQKTLKTLAKVGRQTIYLISDTTHSFSFLNNIYIAEDQLPNAEYIVKHERAHCQQKHTLDLLLIRLVRTVLWFNPVIYLWEQKMKENHEYLADKASISDSTEIPAYSYALLSSHLGVPIPHLANGFNRPSLLRKRIIQLSSHNTISMKQFILIPAILGTVILTTSLRVAHNAPTAKQQIVNDENVVQPTFPGGMEGLVAYIQKNLHYPKTLADENVEGKVFVHFLVSKSGNIKDVSILKPSEHEAFNEEAKRVIAAMPNWTPGTKDGKAVSVEMTLPIQFLRGN